MHEPEMTGGGLRVLMASGQVESHQTSLDECEADVAEHHSKLPGSWAPAVRPAARGGYITVHSCGEGAQDYRVD